MLVVVVVVVKGYSAKTGVRSSNLGVGFFGLFFNKSDITTVLEDGRPPGALVSTKLSESSRFGVGDEN